MKLHFTKLHGTGNDFILVDNFDLKIKQWNNSLIRKLCEFHTGIGADGFIALEKDPKHDFKMRFFNADGFESDMCVNGSRCLCYFAYKLGYVKEEMTFLANDGIHQATIKNDEVEVQVKINEDAGDKEFPDEYTLPEGMTFKNFVNTGVPHVILDVNDIENVDVTNIGQAIRQHSYFKPQGTNVNFVEKVEKQNYLKIRTFERGVEAETKSCGSGATAAVISYARDDHLEIGTYRVKTNGGLLIIRFSDNFKQIYLKGPVKEVFKGIYSLEE
jgi:diaminopimelate epimerase